MEHFVACTKGQVLGRFAPEKLVHEFKLLPVLHLHHTYLLEMEAFALAAHDCQSPEARHVFFR
jgi:hypothetical protein